MWEIRPYNGVLIDVTVPSRAGRSRRERIRLHRSSTLKAEDVTTHRGIPVTTVARTLLDVAATLSEPSLARTLEQSEIRRLFDLTAVENTIARNPNHAGVNPLRRAIEMYRDDEFTRSELEKAFLALCDDHNLPRPLVNHIVEGKEVDFFWPGPRVIVETDGAPRTSRSPPTSATARGTRTWSRWATACCASPICRCGAAAPQSASD